ncbi:sensor histidine kinase [Brevibacillus sp. SYP-B805]|uniref:sensor histidine kinase n=1 Tax=Brevibacillus sp. SYP-B805 TaxID=1578199 RepID=UPI0013EE0EE8|nr:sensor histidine kinase [Brevibacillus sp. SYP-B805]NGQ97401.1 sensor histidine kinase [Brevibacillus sp. SYP-B805]
MGRQSRLTSIQWRFVKQGLMLTAGVNVFLFLLWLAFVLLVQDKPAVIMFFSTYLGVDLLEIMNWKILLFILIVSVSASSLIGMVTGYIAGNLLKKRLHVLWEAAMNLERGVLSYRVPDLGVDELGEIGWQFNRLAAKWEEQVASLQRLSNHNAELGEQLRQSAVTEERQRLARELHDAVSQQLFAIAMTTAAIKRMIGINPQRAAQQIELVEEMAAAAQAEMRALLLHLRPATLQDRSLREAMIELLEELSQKQSLGISWEIEEIPDLPTGIEDHLFRILQEALSNTLRHARAKQIVVKLFTMQGQVRLRVADDGIGFDPEDEKMISYGLRTMRERVNELGGAMEIYSSIGQGTQIEVRIPLMLQTETKEGVNP